MNRFSDTTKDISNIISAVVTLVSLGVSFYLYLPIWNGNLAISSITKSALPWIILLIILLYYRFLADISKRANGLFTILLILWIIFTLALGGVSYYRYQNLKSKFIIRVANFYGPKPKEYQVTEEIFGKMREELSHYNNVEVKPLGTVIKEQEGSKNARKIGKNRLADLVIWGRYAATESKVKSTIHIENLIDPNFLPLSQSGKYQTPRMPASEIQNFRFQIKRAQELSALSTFISGLARYGLREYKEASTRFEDALTLESWPKIFLSKAYVYFYLGNAKIFSRKPEHAIQMYKKALEIKPKLSAAYYTQALAYSELGKYERSIENLNEVIKLEPKEPEAYSTRGSFHTLLNNQEQAKKDFNKAIELDPKHEKAYAHRGLMYIIFNKPERAISDISKAIQINPSDTYYANRGLAYILEEEYEKALRDLNKAINKNPQNGMAYGNRALIYIQFDKPKKALKDFNKAININPQNASLHVNRGLAFIMLEKHEQAITDLKKAFEINPNNSTAHYNLAILYSKLGKYEKAIRKFEEVIKVSPSKLRAYYHLSYLYHEIGKYEAALKTLERMFEVQSSPTTKSLRLHSQMNIQPEVLGEWKGNLSLSQPSYVIELE